jgi:hypothetical protein
MDQIVIRVAEAGVAVVEDQQPGSGSSFLRHPAT